MRYFLVLVLAASFISISACNPTREEPETPLEYGFETRTDYACSESLILDALLKVCNQYAECTKKESCSRVTQELFAGTTLEPVAAPRTTYWNEFGGRGEQVANASLCMLKELSNGGIQNQAVAKLFEVFPVAVSQKIGFLHFDPAERYVDGYQTVSICLPLVGCFDAKESSFRGTIVQRSPAHPLKQSCGLFPVADSYALQLTAEEMAQNLTVKVPPINIQTPYGPIKVYPRFDYYSDMHAILFPLTGDTYAQRDPFHREMHLHDIYGRIPGVNISVSPQDVTPSGAPSDTGWQSQLALGSREPNPDAAIWTRDPDHPVRPDLDLSQARNELEHKPVAGGKAEVLVQYRPPLPSVLTNAPMHTELMVMAKPTVLANFASQFDIVFNEFTNTLRDQGPGLMLSGAQMLSRAEAYASFKVEAGIDLFIQFQSSFFTKTIVDIKPRVNLTIAQNGDQQDTNVGSATTTFDPRFNPEPMLDSYTSHSSGKQANPTDYVKGCVIKPIPDQPKPVAQFTPASSDILNFTQFPCNICVGHERVDDGANTVSDAYSTLVYPTANGPSDWQCNQYHAGCFDMCTYDSSNGTLTVTRTAIGMGLRGQPRNIACNERPPQ